MNLPELLKSVTEQPTWNDRDIINFSNFLRARRKDMKFYSIEDWGTKDTYVIIKWAHQVPGLVVLP